MNDKHDTSTPVKSAAASGWIAVVLGLFLILLIHGFDPIGSDPDTGVFDLGPSGTRWLITGFGLFFVLGGAWNVSRNDRSNRD